MNSFRENGRNVQNLHREVAGSPSTNSRLKQIWNTKQVLFILSSKLHSAFHLPTSLVHEEGENINPKAVNILNIIIFLEYCLIFQWPADTWCVSAAKARGSPTATAEISVFSRK